MSLSASDVSVITPNWNGHRHLEALLPSLLPLGAGEVIVVDNASSDDSVEFLTSHFPKVRVLRNESNLGFASPCNRAAREAQGKVLAFINNDMRCHPDWIAAALPALEEAPCVASRILDWEGQRIDYNGSSLQYLGYAAQRDLGELEAAVSTPSHVLFPCGGAMFILREVFLEVGAFDEDYFAIFEDVDLGWRLWISGHEVRLAPESRVYHRGHGTFQAHSLPKMRYLMHRNALLTIIKNYDADHFRRIVPLAVLLALKRAVRCSGVNREAFYLWREISTRAFEVENPSALENLLDAFNHLVAVDDVIDSLPRTLEKRRRVQAGRRRSDTELFSLFADPLRPIVLDAEYMAAELDLIRSLRLDEIFCTEDFVRALEAAPSRTVERLRAARQELARIQQQGLAAILHPLPPEPRPRSRWRRFLDIWLEEGPVSAIRRAWRAWFAA